MKTGKGSLLRLLSLVCALLTILSVSQPALSARAGQENSLYGVVSLQATKWTKKKSTLYAKKDAAIREKASDSSKKLGTLKKSEKITRTAYSNTGWSKVTYKGKTAYILTDRLTTKKPVVWTSKKVTVYATKKVAIREKASTSSEILDYLGNGKKITRTAYSDNGWSNVTYDGETA